MLQANDEFFDYIVFEGIDGCGKTTLSQEVARVLNAKWVCEPDKDLEITRTLRKFVLDDSYVDVVTDEAREHMLAASRSISTTQVLKILQERFLISDRSLVSGMVYANVASDMGFDDWFMRLMKGCIAVYPDIVVHVKVDKQKIDITKGDIYDSAPSDFHQSIRETFDPALQYIQEKVQAYLPDKMHIIEFNNDFTKTIEENAQILIKKLNLMPTGL